MQRLILPSNLDALIVTNSYNILYLAGFKGISDTEREAILIVTGKKKTLVTAKLYQTEAHRLKGKNLEVKIGSERDQLQQFIFETLKGFQKLGFEKDNLTVAEHEKYQKLLPGKDFVATENIVENLRQIKSPEEVKKIEKAQVISQKALASLTPTIAVGQTELEIKYRLESIMRDLGSEGTAFDTIVASGPNSGIPHHRTGDRQLKVNDTLLFDFGAKFQNYCADLSRTVFVGKPSDRQINIYNHVASAQQSAISKIQREVKLKDAYNFAHEVFVSSRLHDYFTHGLGHGIGLEVHEAPYLRPKPLQPSQTRFDTGRQTGFDDPAFENGMVFSVEPGLYFPWGGVRIEDLVVVKNGKPKLLGKLTGSIIIL